MAEAPAAAGHGRLLGSICRTGGIKRLDAAGASIAVQAWPARRQCAPGGLDRPAAPTASRRSPPRPCAPRRAPRRHRAARRGHGINAVQAGRPARRQVAAERLGGPAAPAQATDRHCGQATAPRPLKSKIAKSKSIARAEVYRQGPRCARRSLRFAEVPQGHASSQ
jgi:hypothetical protein